MLQRPAFTRPRALLTISIFKRGANMPEVQDVFSEYGDAYESSHPMTIQQRKAFYAIRQCRTAALGGHVDECPDCGYQRPSYNSCRNRHCPKCQSLLKERWIENQSFDLLNIQYFHAAFTVPAELDSNSSSSNTSSNDCAASILFIIISNVHAIAYDDEANNFLKIRIIKCLVFGDITFISSL